MKKLTIFLLSALMLFSVGCSNQEPAPAPENPGENMANEGVYTEEYPCIVDVFIKAIEDTYIITTPLTTGGETDSADLIFISLENFPKDTELQLGDVYTVYCDGLLKYKYDDLFEVVYPAEFSEIYKIECAVGRSVLTSMDLIGTADDKMYNLYPIDVDAIRAILTQYEWVEGTGDCLSEYWLIIDDVCYAYHVECGTFNDTTNESSITLTREDKEVMDGLLKQATETRHWSSGPAQIIKE